MLSTLVTASCATATESDDDQGADDTSALATGPQDATFDVATLDDEAGVGAAAALPPISLQTFFSVPLVNGTGDDALQRKVIELVDQAPAGSHIRVALYHFTHTKPAHAFVAAAKRGVHVEIVLDKQVNELGASEGALAPIRAAAVTGDAAVDDAADDATDAAIDAADLADGSTDPDEATDAATAREAADTSDDTTDLAAKAVKMNSAVTILQQGLPAGSITFCTRGSGSCQGDHINHNKIYLFSSLSDGSKDVVIQASANLTGFNLHNNLVISRNDEALYAGYLQTWTALKKHTKNLNYYRSVDGAHTIAYFYPRASGDTITSVLDNVKCSSTSKIRVTMAFFTDGRKAIAASLAHLKHLGCDVQVLMRKAGPESSAAIIKTLKDGHIKVGLYPDTHGSNIHSKYLLIDSLYDTKGKGYVHRKLVYTGSHNYTGGALRDNDETLLRVDNPTVFDAFLANWNKIRAQIP